MAATGLAFYRKNQTLNDLLNERPQSLESLRKSLETAIQGINNQISSAEREFNGGRSHQDVIRKVTKASRGIMKSLELTYLNSSQQIMKIVERTLEPSEVFQFDMEAVETVKDYHRKLIELFPEIIEPLAVQIKQVLKLVQTYCLSFSPIKRLEKSTNPGLETCVHYELKRIELEKAISEKISNIGQMMTAFNSDTGVLPESFGMSSNELARACDCGDITYTLIFPEACSNMRNACQGLKKWLEEDELYVTYIKNDLVSYDNMKVEAENQLRGAKHQEALAKFGRKMCRKEIDDLENEMSKIAKREQKLLKQIDQIEKDTRVTYIELATKEAELKKFKLDALAITDMTEEEYDEGVKKIADCIAKLRSDIPENRHKIESIRSQQKEVFDRRTLLNNKKKELAEHEKNIIKAKGMVFEANEEKKQVNEAFTILKDIHQKKSSPGVTKKIHNELPVLPRHNEPIPKRPLKLPPIKKGKL